MRGRGTGQGARGIVALVAFLAGGVVGAPAAGAQVLADTTAAPPVATPPPAPPRPADPWLGRDKALHAGGSFLLTLSGQYVLVNKGGVDEGDALPLSAGITLGLGVLKETADASRSVRPLFSWRDLAADALGVLLAALVIEL